MDYAFMLCSSYELSSTFYMSKCLYTFKNFKQANQGYYGCNVTSLILRDSYNFYEMNEASTTVFLGVSTTESAEFGADSYTIPLEGMKEC